MCNLVTWHRSKFTMFGHVLRVEYIGEDPNQMMELTTVKLVMPLCWMPQCVTCRPAWLLLYHWTVKSKGLPLEWEECWKGNCFVNIIFFFFKTKKAQWHSCYVKDLCSDVVRLVIQTFRSRSSESNKITVFLETLDRSGDEQSYFCYWLPANISINLEFEKEVTMKNIFKTIKNCTILFLKSILSFKS